MQTSKTKMITIVGVMTALGTVLYMFLPEIVLVPGTPLKIDLSDIPAMITGLLLGPVPGILVEIIKNIIHLTKTTTVGIGEIINVLVGSAVILSMSGCYRLLSRKMKHTRDSVPYYVAGLITVGVTVLAGWAVNSLLTPVYLTLMGIPVSLGAVTPVVWGSTVLNVVKTIVMVVPSYPVVVAMQKALHMPSPLLVSKKESHS